MYVIPYILNIMYVNYINIYIYFIIFLIYTYLPSIIKWVIQPILHQSSPSWAGSKTRGKGEKRRI